MSYIIHIRLAKAIVSLQKALSESSRMIWPGAVVLLLSLLIPAYFTELTVSVSGEYFGKIFLRFFRLSLILTLPILFLPYISVVMQYLLNRGNYRLIQFREERNHEFNRWQIWLIRPFQCMGLAMLIAAKLIAALQLYTSGAVTASTVLLPHEFSPGRFLSVTAIAITTSLLLSFLWTLDDLGIRYSNRKTGEIRMIGKYIGILLPIIFGFYGIFDLFESHARILAIQYIIQMVVILYPPFIVMIVLHCLYIKRYETVLLAKLRTE
ncbi:MAG: hypothetical protein ABFD82_23005 [Syntrophaceae bacterium]